jgi:hypothetical protein
MLSRCFRLPEALPLEAQRADDCHLREIGRRIVESEQHGQQRSEYGESLIMQLIEDLEPRFGEALGGATLRKCGCSSSRARPRRFCRHRLQNMSLSLNLAEKFPLNAIGLTPKQRPSTGTRCSGWSPFPPGADQPTWKSSIPFAFPRLPEYFFSVPLFQCSNTPRLRHRIPSRSGS